MLTLGTDKKIEKVSVDVTPLDEKNQEKKSFFSAYFRPEVIRMFFLGFSAGVPLLLTFGTLSLRMRQAEVDLAVIGFASWVGMVYGFKWVWSPFVDRLSIPFLTHCLGRRRSWMLLAQALVIVGLLGMAFTDVEQGIVFLVGFALLVAFGSATQDIALDAYRIESAEIKMQGALAATYSAGYRLAMIWSGAGALWIVGYMRQLPQEQYDAHAWEVAYIAMALSMLVGVFSVLFSPESKASLAVEKKNQEAQQQNRNQPLFNRITEWVQNSIVAPFVDFLCRYKKQAFVILALIALYRISDVVMGTVSNPFYHYMGYTEMQIANVSKVFGVIMTIMGTFVGGFLVMRVGVFKILFLGAVLSASTNLLFAWLAFYGYGNDFAAYNVVLPHLLGGFEISGKVMALSAVISLDNLSGGIASAAFIAYLSSLTSVQFSATQYALFSSLMNLIPKFVAGFSGVVVEVSSFSVFFVGTALLGAPVLYLVWLAAKQHQRSAVVMQSS